ncbi:dihydrofolate reductase family protein [Solicola gregarius]|uniref:Dihydrofolate reductase family protein n=1 Tax=Solicola gregarius TaxID=2908642 RepID=A0AA46YJC6_9ACTN|nr:dihydrofolate reductase family protein [Solicola gregarius]UYM03404.1 dihydrofolate reductase family protein [Solicola gregarius]
MARVVVTNFTSIDGVIQSPLSADEDDDGGFTNGGWVTPYSDDSVADFMRRATVSASGLLLGGRTYAILAEAWSTADESEPAVAAMNRLPKYVVSRSATLRWHNSERIANDETHRGVRQLKEQASGDLLVLGSGTLVGSLAACDLVDEYRLLVFPVILGSGKRMFDDQAHLAHFDLAKTDTSPSGVVLVTYLRGD